MFRRQWLKSDFPLDMQETFDPAIRHAVCALFCTLTFRHAYSYQHALAAFLNFINARSYGSRANIAWVMSRETKMSAFSEFDLRPHIHAVLLCNKELRSDMIQELWSVAYGNALVEPYDLSKNGIAYILKCHQSEHCDWDISNNMFLFMPGYPPKNKRERRVIKRNNALRTAAVHPTDGTVTSHHSSLAGLGADITPVTQQVTGVVRES
jgi:hypothetical protein